MDSGSEGINVYADAKTEYTRQLSQYCLNAYLRYFLNLFDETKNENEPRKILITYQGALKNISEWSYETVQKETAKLLKDINCDYFEDLLSAVFVAHTKVLSAIRLSTKQKKLQITIPKVEHFLHHTLIECARIIWSNVFLFSPAGSPIDRQKNLRSTEQLIQDGILQSIRSMLPVKNILKEYLKDDGDEEEAVEEKEETIAKKDFVEDQTKQEASEELPLRELSKEVTKELTLMELSKEANEEVPLRELSKESNEEVPVKISKYQLSHEVEEVSKYQPNEEVEEISKYQPNEEVEEVPVKKSKQQPNEEVEEVPVKKSKQQPSHEVPVKKSKQQPSHEVEEVLVEKSKQQPSHEVPVKKSKQKQSEEVPLNKSNKNNSSPVPPTINIDTEPSVQFSNVNTVFDYENTSNNDDEDEDDESLIKVLDTDGVELNEFEELDKTTPIEFEEL